MSKEFRIPHDEIMNSQKITGVTESYFERHDLDIHRHEVETLEDDYKTKERVLKVKNTKYFVM